MTTSESHGAISGSRVSDNEWLRDTAMNLMLAVEVDEAVRILRAAITDLQSLRSEPSEPVAWQSDTVRHLQRAIMDEDDEVRERAANEVAALYAASVEPYAAAMRMVREAIGELFGPVASIESEDASLLRGPEAHHEAEAQIAALQRVKSALASPQPGASS